MAVGVNPSPDAWYVSFRRPDEAGNGYVRSTETFQVEAEAKQFARKLLVQGHEITAGTLNPYSPKKTIGSWQVLDWLAEF